MIRSAQNVLGPLRCADAVADLRSYPYEGTLAAQHSGATASRKRRRFAELEHHWELGALDGITRLLPPGRYAAEWWFVRTPPGSWLDWHSHGGDWAGMYVAANGGTGAYYQSSQPDAETPDDSVLAWPASLMHGIPPEHSPSGLRLVLAANFARVDDAWARMNPRRYQVLVAERAPGDPAWDHLAHVIHTGVSSFVA